MAGNGTGWPLVAMVGAFIIGCAPSESPEVAEARSVLSASIERHGGAGFESGTFTFGFRGDAFRVVRERGLFHHERTRASDEGAVTDVMTNDATHRTVAGVPRPLSPAELRSLETGVNSVIYFAFLPFRLEDPGVRPRHLGARTLEGEPYHLVEVGFTEEEGGRDFHDRFLYWIHERDHTLDYLAYLYHVDGGGTRFRRAINRREVDGLLIQDYENFRLPDPSDPVQAFEAMRRYEGDLDGLGLEWVSDIILDDFRVSPNPT